MKNKSLAYSLVFAVLTLGFLFCLVASFIALSPSAQEQSTFSAASGFAVIYSIFLFISTIPIWIFLYIAAGLILKKYYQHKKSTAGIILLVLALIADGVIWSLWLKESRGQESLITVFISPILLASGIYLIFGTPVANDKSQQ